VNTSYNADDFIPNIQSSQIFVLIYELLPYMLLTHRKSI